MSSQGMEPPNGRVKRKYTRRVKPVSAHEAPRTAPYPTPISPLRVPLDPLLAAQEEAIHAKEGNLKLSKALEIMRGGLETIAYAEMDTTTGLPTTTKDLRILAVAALDAYSTFVGQNWRKAKLKGSYAGDRSNAEGYSG
jgi:hypothetical protein